MKKLLVVFAIGLSSMSVSYALNYPTLSKEIKQKITDDISYKHIDINNQSFLVVNFSIINGKIRVDKIKGSSNQKIRKYIINKLIHLSIESSYDTNKEYAYKFIFKK